MICLADNDIILKLAICNLLDEMVDALGISPKEILVLPTAEYSLGIAKKPEKTRAKLGNEVFERLESFLASVGRIIRTPSEEEQRLFEDAMDIDSGEAVLFSTSAHYLPCLIATGDKRSLKALSSLANATAITARLSGRVICFEQILLRIIRQVGFDFVRTRVVPTCNCDIVLQVAFGSGLKATQEDVERSLSVYAGYLRNETGNLLVDE